MGHGDYKPVLRFDPQIDPKKCLAAVPYQKNSPEMHQCSKYAATDEGYCNLHAKLKERDELERSSTEGDVGEDGDE